MGAIELNSIKALELIIKTDVLIINARASIEP
jgi:hypothetical protein